MIVVGPLGGVAYHGLGPCSDGLEPFGALNWPQSIVTPFFGCHSGLNRVAGDYNGLHRTGLILLRAFSGV